MEKSNSDERIRGGGKPSVDKIFIDKIIRINTKFVSPAFYDSFYSLRI